MPARITRLDCGDHLLTVNPVDGSEIEARRPGTSAPVAGRRTAEDREARLAAARPPAAGPTARALPLLEREAERERLTRHLGAGRSVRVTGPAGAGRSALLDAVAADCSGLAPDGVVRLSGHRQTAGDLLYSLHATVFDVSRQRPDEAGLLEAVREIGAVVVIDDLECGGTALDELLRATPECAYLLGAAPDTPAPSESAQVEEVALGGLSKAGAVALLEHALGRSLTEEETAWAGDLWFAGDGLPLRFVQAAALLRQREEQRRSEEDEDGEEPGVFEERSAPTETGLPGIGQAAAPAVLLASRLSESARAALRFAVALGGELPHQAHLPALIGDTHADTAVGELLACGLIGPSGSRYRLAAGVARQLEEAGYGDEAAELALTAAQHYTWWTGHGSVSPDRAVAEADAVLAALATLVPGQEDGKPSAAVLLARTAAPAFAAGLHWGAWERILRAGQEAARIAGEVAEEAYFHHERGILALCNGQLDRARAELEASIGLRGALADKRGTVAGRRALALVADREGGPRGPSLSPPLVLEAPKPSEALTRGLPVIDLGAEETPLTPKSAFPQLAPPTTVTATPPRPVPPLVPSAALPADAAEAAAATPATGSPAATPPGRRPARRAVLRGARRNVLAAAAGAVLAAVLGTVATIGLTGGDQQAEHRPRGGQSVSGGSGEGPARPGSTEGGDDGNGGGASGGDGEGRDGSVSGGTGGPGDPSATGGTPGPGASASTPGGTPSGPTGRPVPPSTSGGPGPTGAPEPTGKPEPTDDPEPTVDPEPTDDPEPTVDPEPTDDPPPTGGPAGGTSSGTGASAGTSTGTGDAGGTGEGPAAA